MRSRKDVQSAGAVVVQRRRAELYYLLVKHQKGLHWGLPKGHIDPGETRETTALREIREETGLEVELLSDFCRRVRYPITNDQYKTVWYFIATTSQTHTVLPPDEIRHAVWLELDDACRLVTHRNTANLMRAANSWIRQTSERIVRIRETA